MTALIQVPRGGRVRWEVLGGDVPLGTWNPETISELVQLNFARLNSPNPPYPRVAFRLICINLNLPIWLFYIFEWQFPLS